MGSEADKFKSEWKELISEVFARFKQVFRPIMFLYFVVIIITIGGFGAWVQLYRGDIGGFFESLGTYAIAIVAAASFDLIFSKSETTPSHLRVVAYMGFAASTVLAFMAFQAKMFWETNQNVFVVAPATLLTFAAWTLWILANSHNSNFSSDSSYNAIGGSAQSELSGSLEGFQA